MAQQGTDRILNQHISVIVDKVHSFLRSRLTCPNCDCVHDTIDTTACLQIPIPLKRTRIVEVIFLDANNPRVPFTIYGLELSISAQLIALKKEIAEIRNTTLNVEVYEVMHGKPKRRFRNDDLLSTICSRTGYIVASHDKPPDDGVDFVNILCFNEIPVKRRGWRNGSVLQPHEMQPFGFPFIVSVPVGPEGEIDIQKLRKRIWYATTSLRNGPSPECYKLFQDDKSTFKDWCTEIPNFGSFILEKRILLVRWDKDRCKKDYFNYKKLPQSEDFPPTCGQFPNAPKSCGKRKGFSLKKCLDVFFEDERMDVENQWECRDCHQYVRPIKTLSWWRPPDVLVIQLNRVLWNFEKQ